MSAALAAFHNFISIHNPYDHPISSTISDTVQMYDSVGYYTAEFDSPMRNAAANSAKYPP
jgi:hypothetical protein